MSTTAIHRERPQPVCSEPHEQGAETLRLADGSGYGVAVCDYTQPDGRVLRVVTLLAVDAQDRDQPIFEQQFFLPGEQE